MTVKRDLSHIFVLYEVNSDGVFVYSTRDYPKFDYFWGTVHSKKLLLFILGFWWILSHIFGAKYQTSLMGIFEPRKYWKSNNCRLINTQQEKKSIWNLVKFKKWHNFSRVRLFTSTKVDLESWNFASLTFLLVWIVDADLRIKYLQSLTRILIVHLW